MHDHDDDLRQQLEKLAERGTPRGAKAVLDGARGATPLRALRSARLGPVRMVPAVAIAASVMLVAGVAAAFVTGGGNGHSTTVALPGSTSTVPGAVAPTTSNAPLPEVSLPAKLIAASRLVPFNTCGALLSQTKAKALSVVGPYGLPGFGGVATGGPMFAAREGAPGATTSGQASSDSKSSSAPAPQSAMLPAGGDQFSQTNNQEAGVDEPDTVKTDGKRLFTLAGGKLWALSADGAPRVLGSLPLETASELLLAGNRIIAVGFGGPIAVDSRAGAGPAGGPSSGAPVPYQPGALATVVDVSNPAAMKITGKLTVDGAYVSARMVGGVARIVFQSTPHGMEFSYPQDGSPEAQAQAAAKNRDVVKSSTLANWTPGYTLTDASGRQRSAGRLVDCGASYRPPTFSGFGMLSVVTLDADHPEKSDSTSVMADGQIVYASSTRMYVASNSWGQINGQVVQPVEQTLIHEFDISDPTAAHYKVSGQVRGTVLNQFSMSEDKGVLRVATTVTDPNGRGNGESFVTTMGDVGKALVQMGQVGGLGKGERIYAVRFLGGLGYVVTFRQTDPLYVVDVSDPAKPVVKGALELLGYSAYLHPIGPGLLLGVGQDATPEGRRAGTQASVFDVSNPAAPKLLQRYSLGSPSSSQVEFDHHAFLYWEPTKLAVLPVQEYGQNGPGFSGAIGLRASSAGISEVGRIQHPQQQQQGGGVEPQPAPADGGSSSPPSKGSYAYTPPIDRSVVIGNRLFTFSANGVLASNLTSLAQQAWVPYPS